MALITSKFKSLLDQSELNNSPRQNKEKLKREKETKNIRKCKIEPKAFSFSSKPYIILFFIILALSVINAQDGAGSIPSFITLKFNGTNETGFVQFLGLDFNNLPDKLFIDGIDQNINTWNTKYVNIIDKTHTVKLQWNSKLQTALICLTD